LNSPEEISNFLSRIVDYKNQYFIRNNQFYMAIKAVLFDMDGVLIDAREWHYDALNQALALFGYVITRAEHENFYN
jgi:hypothetical protein